MLHHEGFSEEFLFLSLGLVCKMRAWVVSTVGCDWQVEHRAAFLAHFHSASYDNYVTLYGFISAAQLIKRKVKAK